MAKSKIGRIIYELVQSLAPLPVRKLTAAAISLALIAAAPGGRFYEAWAAAGRRVQPLTRSQEALVHIHGFSSRLIGTKSGATRQAALAMALLPRTEAEKLRIVIETLSPRLGMPEALERRSEGEPNAAAPRPLEESIGSIRELERVLSAFSTEELRQPEVANLALHKYWDRVSPQPGSALEIAFQHSRRPDGRRAPGLLPHAKRNAETILSGAERMRREMVERLDAKEEIIGSDALDEEINGNKVEFRDPDGFGKAEATLIDGQRVIRLVHSASNLAIVFLDPARVAPTSKHLARFIASQHIDGGRSRTDGQKGRDLVVVWHDAHGQVREIKNFPRHERLTRGWWRDLRRATLQRPTAEDFWQGLLWAFVQQFSMLYVFWLKKELGLLPVIHVWPAIFTFGFGLVMGTISSTYYNWVQRGSIPMQLLKTHIISMLFAYPVIGMTAGWESLMLLSTHVWANLSRVVNNMGKVAWQTSSRIARTNRLITGYFTLARGVKFKRATFFNQLMYWINWLFGLIILIDLRNPWGWALYGVAAPFGYWLGVRYAEAHNVPEALALRRNWETFKAFTIGLIPIVRALYSRAIEGSAGHEVKDDIAEWRQLRREAILSGIDRVRGWLHSAALWLERRLRTSASSKPN